METPESYNTSLTSVWNFQKASEFDQEMSQLDTTDRPMALQ